MWSFPQNYYQLTEVPRVQPKIGITWSFFPVDWTFKCLYRRISQLWGKVWVGWTPWACQVVIIPKGFLKMEFPVF